MKSAIPTAGYPAVWVDAQGVEHAAQITQLRDAESGLADLVVFAHGAVRFVPQVHRSSAPQAHCWTAAGGIVPVAALIPRIDELEAHLGKLEARLGKLDVRVAATEKKKGE